MLDVQPVKVDDPAEQEPAIGYRDPNFGQALRRTGQQLGKVCRVWRLKYECVCRQRPAENPVFQVEKGLAGFLVGPG